MSIPSSIRVGESGDEDLLLAVEDAFNLTFSQEELAQIFTVGDLYWVVHDKLATGLAEGCLSSVAFYRFRSALIQATNIDRDKVKPNALLEFLIPADDRQAIWLQLQEELAVKLPELRFAEPIENLLFWVCVGSSIALLVGVLVLVWHPWSAPFSQLALIISIIVLILAAQITKNKPRNPHANRIPIDCATVGRLVDQIVTWNYGSLAERTGKFRANEVFAALRNIIVETLLAEPEAVVPSARLSQFPGWE